MNLIKCEKLEKSMAELQFSIDAEAFKKAVADVFKKEGKKYPVQGFRKGKAPKALIEKMYGADVFTYDAINELFPEAFEAAAKEAGVEPVGRPEVSVDSASEAEGATLTVKVAVKPEVKVGSYNGLTVEKTVHTVTDEAVDAELKRVQERNARELTREGAAQNGDIVDIDFEGFVDGVAFEGGKAEHYSLTLGSGSFIPGFEDQVIGMKAGEEKDIDITFPENYHADLAGKAVVFKVKVHEVKEKEVPAMDDEFAKDVSEFDTLKDLKADLKKKITEERQKDADRVFEENLMNQVAENITADIPDVMVENQAHQYLDNFKAQISRQFPYEEYKKMTGMDDAKLLEEAKEPALRQVKMDLATAAIIKAENIEASDEEVEAEFAKMAEQFGMDVEMVKKYLSKEQVHDQILTQKAVAVVVDSATAEKPAKKTAKKAEAAEGEEKKPAKKTTKKAETAEGEEKPKKAPAKKAAKKEEKEAE